MLGLARRAVDGGRDCSTMILGVDFYGTVDRNPKLYKKLINHILDGGGAVHLISQVEKGHLKKAGNDIRKSHIKFSGVHIIECDFKDAPQKKLEKCRELKVQMFIDDRSDTCKLLSKYGILSLRANIY